ncbi:membrane protein [Noviherbaspirillum humi]|uniref:Membrane protein n=1 Tax=Noviherbaspirillum humi TaxID=1688639 RepID=A0A239KZ22_9BURK|nr:YihY/virulence factor BrkB family protein [Noviherbaspirillum humi]SNT23002.1 membrane protein [Noviherbaspirillum humi]
MKASKKHAPQGKNMLDVMLALANVATAAYGMYRRRHAPPEPRMPQPAVNPEAAGSAPLAPTTPVASPAKHQEKRQAEEVARATHQNGSYAKSLLHVAIAAAKAWVAHRAASKGAALALYTLFSLAPILILVVTLAGLFFGREAVTELLLSQMNSLMGSQGADAVRTIIAGSQSKSTGIAAGVVSFVLLLVSATTAFAELKDSLDELWEVKKSETSGIMGLLKERFLSVGLLLVLALMLLASLVVSTALSALGNLWSGSGSSEAFELIAKAVSTLVSFGIVTGLFAVIFKYLPAVKIAWKDVFIGAVLTALLFTVGKIGIGLYVAHGNFSTAYGAAGSVVVLITWIYYSAQIFFYGSLFTHEYAMTIGSRKQEHDQLVQQEARNASAVAQAGAAPATGAAQ